MPDPERRPDLATLLAGVAEGQGGSITPPIYQTSLFAFDSFQDFEDRMAGRTDQAMYTRVQLFQRHGGHFRHADGLSASR